MSDLNQAKVLRILQSAIASQQALNQALLQQLTEIRVEQAETQWVSLEDGAKAMGSAFSARKILDDLKAGFLKHGTHYINTSNGNRPNYAVKVAALRRVYESPPEKRRAY
jgi:hypothetical protein